MTTHTYPRYDASTGLKRYSELSGWKVEVGHQDIRKMPVFTPAGVEVGRVEDLLVDEAHERVQSVLLDDGHVVPVEPLEILDDRVVDHGAGHAHAAGARVVGGKVVRG